MRVPPRSSSPSLRRSLSRSLRRALEHRWSPPRQGLPSHGRPGPLPSPEEPRSLAVSYLLWGLCAIGVCGVHRFYARRPLSGLLWLFSFGLCGVGQLADLILIPSLVRQANQSALLDDALAVLARSEAAEMAVSLERQLLLLARQAGPKGFTLNDALVDLQLPHAIDSAVLRAEIERLLRDELLDVGNDDRGRVVYREP